jgi:hypothetical protein
MIDDPPLAVLQGEGVSGRPLEPELSSRWQKDRREIGEDRDKNAAKLGNMQKQRRSPPRVLLFFRILSLGT